MSSTLSEFSSGNDGTRPIQQGDTPDIQNDFAVSVAMGAENITKGTKCFIVGGFVVTTVAANNTFPVTPCVPTESKDNSTGAPGDLELRVMLPGQMVALLGSGIFTVGQYGTITGTDVITALSETAINTTRKYSRYMGKEGAIFARDGTTPYTETLSVGIVPDQNLADAEVGWFKLVESAL